MPMELRIIILIFCEYIEKISEPLLQGLLCGLIFGRKKMIQVIILGSFSRKMNQNSSSWNRLDVIFIQNFATNNDIVRNILMSKVCQSFYDNNIARRSNHTISKDKLDAQRIQVQKKRRSSQRRALKRLNILNYHPTASLYDI